MSDNWDFYRLLVDHSPASIMVDLGIRDAMPVKTHKAMGYLRTHMNNPRKDGLSSQEEFDKLCEIADAIEQAITTPSGAHLYLGRNTSSYNRDFYFYTSDLDSLHNCLETVIKQFPEYRFELGGQDDPGWSTYLNFLYPSPVQMQQIQDNRVCYQLEQNGDDLTIEREIDHRIYLQGKNNLQELENYLRENDFTGIQRGKTKPLLGKHYIDFKHFGAPDRVSDVVYDLFKKSEELGGEYDGWGCSVQKTPVN